MVEISAFRNKKFISLLFGLNMLNAIDLIETKTALACGFIELNPLINFFYNAGLFEIGKLGMVALGTVALLVLHKYDKKLALGCVVILVCWFIFVVVWNFIQLF
nr:DUF5658 family protein [Candidatus Freyarchaeota archaeon]